MTEGSRRLEVGALARVEGEGALYVAIEGDSVTDVELRIYEPPRFFEAFLRGRRYTEPPDITARICGICPVAYQMSACLALEDALGVEVDGPLRALRRLLYCGEWIESHTLHVYLLHAPDFLGYDGALSMAADDPDRVQRGLDLKRAGNEIVEVVGGRAIHPVNVRVGGFHRVPTRRELRPVREHLLEAREIAVDTVRWVSGFEAPELTVDHELVAVTHPDEYAVVGGRVRSTRGLDVAPSEYGDQVDEAHVAHSTALQAELRGRGRYLTGPQARFALNSELLSPGARDAAAEAGIDGSGRNPFRSIVIRAVEVLHACDEALTLIDAYEPPEVPAVPVEPAAGVGHGVTEAPRGLLYHRYALDGDGLITDALIVPPTSQNQASIEEDLLRFVQEHVGLDDDALRHGCEQVIRNHDPCISCATHFLDLHVDRR